VSGDAYQNIIDQSELDFAIQMSKNEYFSELEKIIPTEPSTNESHVTANYNPGGGSSQNFQRRFRIQDKIIDVKNYARIKLRQDGDNVKLFGEVNNKIYVKDDQTLQEAGVHEGDTLKLVVKF
jgi:hypothetical protein